MAKKKHKQKKHKCPDNEKFGYDFDFDCVICSDCRLYKECELEHNRLIRKGKIRTDDKDKDEDWDKESKKEAKAKHKNKKKQDHRSVLIPPEALNKLESLPSPHNRNCIVLYTFYLKTAIKQKNPSIWCTDSYVAGKYISGKIAKGKERKGLKWDASRVAITKKWLVKLGFIKVYQKRGERGCFGKEYIEVEYYPSKMKIEKEEYLRQMDMYDEEFAGWCNVFTSELNKLEVKLSKCNKSRLVWKRKYLKLKKNV